MAGTSGAAALHLAEPHPAEIACTPCGVCAMMALHLYDDIDNNAEKRKNRMKHSWN
jgi:hypothetical protein